MAKTPLHHILGMVLSLDHHFWKLLSDLKSPNVLWQTVKEGAKSGHAEWIYYNRGNPSHNPGWWEGSEHIQFTRSKRCAELTRPQPSLRCSPPLLVRPLGGEDITELCYLIKNEGMGSRNNRIKMAALNHQEQEGTAIVISSKDSMAPRKLNHRS